MPRTTVARKGSQHSSENIDALGMEIFLGASDYSFAAWESHRVYQADKFHGRNVTAVTTHLASVPMGIQLLHPYRQPALLDLEQSPTQGGARVSRSHGGNVYEALAREESMSDSESHARLPVPMMPVRVGSPHGLRRDTDIVGCQMAAIAFSILPLLGAAACRVNELS